MKKQKGSNRTEAAGNDKRRKREMKGERAEQVQSLRRHLLHNDMLLVVQCFPGRDSKKLHLFTSMLSAHPLGIDERSFKGSQLENHEGNIKTSTTHNNIFAYMYHMSFHMKKRMQKVACQYRPLLSIR